MNAQLKSPRKNFGKKKLSLSYSSGTLNKFEVDSSSHISSFYKPVESSKILELENKQFKGKLPPLVNHNSLNKKTNDNRYIRKNHSEPKIRPNETKLLGKLDSDSFSVSASNIIKRVGLPKIQTESDDYPFSDSSRRNQSLIVEGIYTPTFRNIYCENKINEMIKPQNISVQEKKESTNSLSEQKSAKYASCKGLIKMSSHFINGIKNMGTLLKESIPVHKKVKKIKVLEHKFPKDMFC